MFELKSAVEYRREDENASIPSYSARKNVQIRQVVRLILKEGDKVEWLWFAVTGKVGARYTGQMLGSGWNYYRHAANKIKSAKVNTVVTFLPKHIFAIRS